MSLKIWHIFIFIAVYFSIALSVRVIPNAFIFLKVLLYMCIGIVGSSAVRFWDWGVNVFRGLIGMAPRVGKGLRSRRMSVELPVDRFGLSEMPMEWIHDRYIKHSIPVVIKVDTASIQSFLHDYAQSVLNLTNHRSIYRVHRMEPRLRSILQKLVDKWHVGTEIQDGRYRQPSLSMKATFDYEAKWVYRGVQSMTILPREANRLLSMKLSGDRIRPMSSNWRQEVPYHYRVDLEPGDILIYDVANCLHETPHNTGHAQHYAESAEEVGNAGDAFLSISFHFMNFQSSTYTLDALRFLSSVSQIKNFRLN